MVFQSLNSYIYDVIRLMKLLVLKYIYRSKQLSISHCNDSVSPFIAFVLKCASFLSFKTMQSIWIGSVIFKYLTITILVAKRNKNREKEFTFHKKRLNGEQST